jgi:hypothetical protein
MSVVLRRGGLSRRARLKFRFDFPHTKFPPHLHRKSTLRDPRNTISSISNPKRLRRVQHGRSPPLCGQTRCSGVTRFFAAVSRVWGFLPPVFPRIFNPGSKFLMGSVETVVRPTQTCGHAAFHAFGMLLDRVTPFDVHFPRSQRGVVSPTPSPAPI